MQIQKTVLLAKESEFDKNKLGQEVIATLKDMPQMRVEPKRIHVVTNSTFNTSNAAMKSFEMYLQSLRQVGVVAIMITLGK